MINNSVENDSIVSQSQLGIEAFNKTIHSVAIKIKKYEEQRKKSVTNNTALLAYFQEKRREESRKKGYPIPESKAEYFCRQEIASAYEQDQLNVAALIYSFQNFAHILYTHRDEIYKNNRIDLGPKRLPQAIADIKTSTIKRQFLEQSSVPTEQRASNMWATMFSVLERINSIESVFSVLKILFHEEECETHFSCAKECLDAKNMYNLFCDGTLEQQYRAKVKREKCRRTCVAESFFDQFYVPLCFIRRNAFHKDTQFNKNCVLLKIKIEKIKKIYKTCFLKSSKSIHFNKH